MKEGDIKRHKLYDFIIYMNCVEQGDPEKENRLVGPQGWQEGAGRIRSVGAEFILGIMEDVLELDTDRAA